MSRAKHAIAWLSVSVGFWGEGEKFTAVKEKAALDLERETEREHHCETEWKVTKLILALLPFNNCLKPKLCLKKNKKVKMYLSQSPDVYEMSLYTSAFQPPPVTDTSVLSVQLCMLIFSA